MSLPTYTLTIQPDWIDYNGHMNVSYYVLAFDQATDALYDDLGIGEAYVKAGRSVFTLGMNVDYLREMFLGEEAIIKTQLLDADHKRILYIHQMFSGKSGELVATNECLGMNVDMSSKKSAPFPAAVQATIDQMLAEHQTHQPPPQAGRKLEIRRK